MTKNTLDPSTTVTDSMANSTLPVVSSDSLHLHIAERSAELKRIAQELKSELFGIDEVIDRVMESVRAWYVLPQIIERPVIIGLWGLTGTGKTQLTRKLAQKLGFYSRFVEVQMDGFSNDSGRRSSTISGMLADTIAQGEAGILVLDEFQRFRTIDTQGKEVRVERYMDVWTLLSDGRLAPSLSFMEDLQMSLASSQYKEDRDRSRNALISDEPDWDGSLEDETDESDQQEEINTTNPQARPQPRRFSLSPYEAKELKGSLKLAEPLTEIMTWSRSEVMGRLQAYCNNPAAWETDYSKLLIFICGNLDEMYADLATRVQDCDSDADVFHALSRKLSVIDVKRALTQRFKPEQIARLGNTHIVYPSFNRATFERLVSTTAQRYLNEVQATSGLVFKLSEGLLAQLYANGVFPTQGTRPLFSSIHGILSGALVHFTLWALEMGALPGDQVLIDVILNEGVPEVVEGGSASDSASASASNSESTDLEGTGTKDKNTKLENQDKHGYISAELVATCMGKVTHLPVLLEISQIKDRRDADFKALLAVHEAGHGLVYTLLFGQAPLQINIQVAAYPGGFNTLATRQTRTPGDLRNAICVDMAGRAAEQLVFGPENITSGAVNDIQHATGQAAEYVRYLGFGQRLSRTDRVSDESDNVNTDMAPTNATIEIMVQQQFQRAKEILNQKKDVLLKMSRALQLKGSLTRQEVMDWVGIKTEKPAFEVYAAMLDQFEKSFEVSVDAGIDAGIEEVNEVGIGLGVNGVGF